MTTKLVKLASDDDHITKSGLSDGRRAKLLPSVVEIVYNCHCSGGYLGNVGCLQVDENELKREHA